MDLTIVEMGVEEKMTPEDQDGGYSHHTLHCTSSDPCFVQLVAEE